MIRLIAVPLVIVLCAAGCSTSENVSTDPNTQIEYGELFVLEQGSSTVLDGQTLRFDGVAGDSRCPANTTCVWEGVAQVHLSLVDDDRAIPIQLEIPGLVEEETEPQDSQTITAGGYVFTIHALNPYPGADDDGAVRVTLSVRSTP
ncbi:MAG: hypothetical protein R3284_06895 [Rubricoccaceae bacterium]|nr:hypothetical protein [Rubricoccaceae bacterium]